MDGKSVMVAALCCAPLSAAEAISLFRTAEKTKKGNTKIQVKQPRHRRNKTKM